MSMGIRVTLLALALSGCERQADEANVAASDRPASADAAEPGATGADVAAARAYLAHFTSADQTPCFGDVEATGAKMQARRPADFTVSPDVTRVVVAIDGSGSMAATFGGRSRLVLAKEATSAFVDSLGPDVEASLLVFGQQGDNSDGGKARSCRAIDQLAPVSRDRAALKQAVQSVRAVGWTPLALALQQAQAELAAAPPGRQVIYVVSDGNETCGGDPVATARAINTGTTRAVVNIIGFGLPASDRAALATVAAAGGGRLIDIADDAAYRRMLAGIAETMRLTNNRVEANNAQSYNRINTSAVVTRATICTGEIITRESLNVGTDLTRRSLAKQPAPERRLVFNLLDQRHKAMTARREAFTARLTADRDRSIGSIDATERAAR